jgi:hypothetical protein
MQHIQCRLKKGDSFQVTWIPEKYAKKGKYIKLKEDNGWQVVEIYSKKDSKEVQKRSVDYKHQREVSDI